MRPPIIRKFSHPSSPHLMWSCAGLLYKGQSVCQAEARSAGLGGRRREGG